MQREAIEIKKKFTALFDSEPLIVRSPGRINLIGEHTDYNDGFVMPAAIDKEIIFAIGFSTSASSTVYAQKYDEQYVLDAKDPKVTDHPKWANYLLGVLYQFQKNGHDVKPFNCVFGGDIPMGAGLSSSAAMECGFGFAINELHGFGVSKIDIVKMAQWAEHNYVGVKCGIMDQFASMMSKEGYSILLDCRSLVFSYAPLDLKDYTIVLCDSKVKHSLVDSEYNTRRNECEKGVSILKGHYPQIKSLRDVTIEMMLRHRQEFTGKIYNRCFYVVQENHRVLEAARDLDRGDVKAFGKKMYETHEGLSALYEVSCKELDFLVDEARNFREVLGARMMGGGFGGCTINIVKNDFVPEFEQHMKAEYKKAFGIDMQAYLVKIRQGTSVIPPENVIVSKEVTP
jgi:galactokinase